MTTPPTVTFNDDGTVTVKEHGLIHGITVDFGETPGCNLLGIDLICNDGNTLRVMRDQRIPPMPASKVQEHSRTVWNHIAAALGPKEPMTTQPTLIEIAKALEAKGLLPEGVFSCDLCSSLHIHDNDGNIVNLEEPIAHAILRDAMAMSVEEVWRQNCDDGWVIYGPSDDKRVWDKDECRYTDEPIHEPERFMDSDYNNNPTLSLYAAWCWANREIK